MIYQWFFFRMEEELLEKLNEGWEFVNLHLFYDAWLLKRNEIEE